MLNHIPYNSRKLYHKSKFGAVRDGEEIIFRLVMPRKLCVRAMYIVINKDGCHEAEFYKFSWEQMQGDDEEWWRLAYTPKEKGLYWYHFEFDAQFGRSRISKSHTSTATLSGGSGRWQLTVFDKNFNTPDDFKGGIIYQIFPDRFSRSGKKKTNVPGDRIMREDIFAQPYWKCDENGEIKNNDFFGGDLKGIEQKLDYIASLGVNCIYLNPIFMAQSNHRYDTGDYERIDPLLGTEADFKSLCKKAKEKGIRIILDGVFSHTGIDSKYFNFYGNYDSLGAYQSKESEFFCWYKFVKWPDDYVSWWGIKILPEVNEENESFLEYITGDKGILKKWLKLGASGWRLDVADELPDVFLDRLRQTVKSENPNAYILGEVWEDASNKTSYSQRRRYLLGDQLDGVMNYPFSQAVTHFVRTGQTDGFSEKIMSVLENYPKPCVDVLMNHIGSHDTARILNVLGGEDFRGRDRKWQSEHFLSDDTLMYAKKLLKIAAAIQFTLPGIPSVYYGDEAGLQGYADPFNRGFFPWGREDYDLIEYYRQLGNIRRQNSCFVDGSFEIVSDVCGCIAFFREGEHEKIMTVANRNLHHIDYYLPEEWKCSQVLLGGEPGDGFVKIPADTAAIVKLTK